jgi:hypothetical protein
MVARSRQLLRETDAIAKGYMPTGERTRLLGHLATAQRLADNGAALLTQQRRLMKSLASEGRDITQAENALKKYEKATAQNLTEIEGLLDELDELTPPG